MVWLATAGILAIYLALVWFVGTFLHLRGNDLWFLRGALAALGFIGAGVYVWYHFRSKRDTEPAANSMAAVDDEIDALLREAEIRLRASKLGRGVRLRSLPIIFLFGQPGSTKTTTVVHSGINPELLAGRVYDDNAIVPTRLANLWFTHGTVLVEVAGAILSQPERWARLVQKLEPGRRGGASGKTDPAPRAAIVFISAETFLQPDATDAAAAAARDMRSRLQEMSQLLGISFPIYVLFTKTDQVPYFAEYVRNLNAEDVSQVFGATFPLVAAKPTGVYAEDENRRLGSAFETLFYSLADNRSETLKREGDNEKLPGIYEFPREFRKVRKVLVQFLVDLVRPSQLRANPFLRGFYFTGVRAVVVTDSARAPEPADVKTYQEQVAGRAATTMFQLRRTGTEAAQSAAPARRPSARKVPEWVFLGHLFSDVLLKDRTAMGASRVSFKVSYWKRALMCAALLLCVAAIVLWTVSYFQNAALKKQVLAATQGMSATGNGQMVSTADLRRLDSLRQSVQTLATYNREGPPWTMRWGLYIGDAIYPGARRSYFQRLHEMLVGPAQSTLLNSLQQLPAAPGATDDYGSAYDDLKAYLITTSNHDKSTKIFLSPVLLKRWPAGPETDVERAQLAKRNFDFYADELKIENPYSSENDTLAIERARSYLGKFGGVERIYKFMVAEASKAGRPVKFEPRVRDVVVDTREVEGAFTRDGWAFVQDALQHADRFVPGERWVLGDQAGQGVDPAQLQQQLRTRYLSDYVEQWRTFLKAAHVSDYSSLRDAANKLGSISSNESPLLQLFGLVSKHTAVGSPELSRAFQSVQTVVPPTVEDRYIGPSNDAYMRALVTLQASLGQIVDPTTDKPAIDQSLANASAAFVATRQIAQAFPIDPEAHIEGAVEKLMEDPITSAQRVLRGGVSSGLNGKGGELCGPVRDLTRKFPFNSASKQDAAVQEMNAVFQPQSGKIWAFYDSTLHNFVTRQGAQFVPNPSGGVSVNPALLQFLSHADGFTQTVYPAGSPQPRLTFTVRSYEVEGIQDLTLSINGQTLTTSGTPLQFVWNGSGAQEVRVTGRLGGSQPLVLLSYEGPWAVFHFFNDADRRRTIGQSTESLEWIIKTGGQPMRLADGRPVTVRFDVETVGVAPVFRRGYLASIKCESTIAKAAN